jgi:chaperonin GroES
MAVNITPLHDRVLVRRLEEKESIKGGIIIPDSAGDRILFGKYSGNDITIDGEEFMIMKEDEILAKLGPAAKAAGKR